MAKKIQFTPETEVEAVADTPVDFTPENVDPSGDSFNINDVIKLKPEQYRTYSAEDKTGPEQIINPITKRPDDEGFWSKALNLPEARKDTRSDNVMFSSGLDYSKVDEAIKNIIPGLSGKVLGKIGEFIASTPEGILSDPMSPALGLLGASRPRPIQRRLEDIRNQTVEPLPTSSKLKTTLTAEGKVIPKSLVSPEEFTGQQTIKALESKPLETLKPSVVEQPKKIDFVPDNTAAAQSNVAAPKTGPKIINDIVPESTVNRLADHIKGFIKDPEGSFKPKELFDNTRKLLRGSLRSTAEDINATDFTDEAARSARVKRWREENGIDLNKIAQTAKDEFSALSRRDNPLKPDELELVNERKTLRDDLYRKFDLFPGKEELKRKNRTLYREQRLKFLNDQGLYDGQFYAPQYKLSRELGYDDYLSGRPKLKDLFKSEEGSFSPQEMLGNAKQKLLKLRGKSPNIIDSWDEEEGSFKPQELFDNTRRLLRSNEDPNSMPEYDPIKFTIGGTPARTMGNVVAHSVDYFNKLPDDLSNVKLRAPELSRVAVESHINYRDYDLTSQDGLRELVQDIRSTKTTPEVVDQNVSSIKRVGSNFKRLVSDTEGSFRPQEMLGNAKQKLLKLRDKTTDEVDTIRTQLLSHLVDVGRIDVNAIYGQVKDKLSPTQFDKVLNDIIDSGDLQKAYKSKTSSASSVGVAAQSMKPVSLQDSLNSLTDAISQHQQARLAQDEIVRGQKSERASKLESLKGQGYEGYQKQREALKGEYGKVNVAPIKDAISNVNMSAMMNMVDDKIPDVYQSFRAKQAIEKAFGLSELKGALQPNEIDLLTRVFGQEVTQKLAQMNSVFGIPEGEYSQVGKDWVKWGNLSKSIQSAYDLSAPLRQGVPLMLRKEYYPAFAKMFKYAGSEDSYKGLQSYLKNDWKYKDLAKATRLAITDIGSDMSTLPREEHFLSALPEKVPLGAGKLYRGSERAFTGFIDKVRADVFTSLIDDLQRAGIKTHETVRVNTADGIVTKVIPSKEAMDAAKYVNTASGRGSLGKAERYGDLMNLFFYSPRFQVSRLDLMTKFLRPDTYTKLNPIIRREYLKSLLAIGGVAVTTQGLGYAFGGKLNPHMTSSDFGKIAYGKIRQDPGAGFNQYLTLAARMVYNGSTSTKTGEFKLFGEGFKPESRLSTLQRFGRTKASPSAGYVYDSLKGEDMLGQPFDWSDPTNVAKQFVPLLAQDIYALLKEDPKAWPLIAPATLGQGIQVYEDLKKKKAKQSGSFLGRELKRTN